MPQFLHLPPLAAAIVTITGVVLAVVRLLTASKAFWWRFPEWLQKGLPAALVALGTLPTALEHAKSWMDVAVAFVFAVGAWFTASRGDQRPVEPKAPTVPPVLMLTLRALATLVLSGSIFMLTFAAGVSCSSLGAVKWPPLGACLEPLSPGLVQVVADILASNGYAESDLATLGKTEGPEAVECAVKHLLSDLGNSPVTARASRQSERARAFLAKVPR